MHDLESGGDPRDRVEHAARVAGRRQRRRQPEHDLGLDARLVQAGQRRASPRRRARARPCGPTPRPHRPVDAIARPDRAVGEADLAADRAPASAPTRRSCRSREHLVRALDVELRIGVGDRRELRAAVGGGEQPLDDPACVIAARAHRVRGTARRRRSTGSVGDDHAEERRRPAPSACRSGRATPAIAQPTSAADAAARDDGEHVRGRSTARAGWRGVAQGASAQYKAAMSHARRSRSPLAAAGAGRRTGRAPRSREDDPRRVPGRRNRASTRRRIDDNYSSMIAAAIFEPLYAYDYFARPAKLVPAAAESLPEVSAATSRSTRSGCARACASPTTRRSAASRAR